MSEKDIEAGRIVIASAGIIIWRKDLRGKIKILAGRRKNEPWVGHLMVVFGGLVDAKDGNILAAAFREGREESGVRVKQKRVWFVGHYGPGSLHRRLAVGKNGKIISRPTPFDISDKYKFVMTVYAAEYAGGKLKEGAEVSDLMFVDPADLARDEIAFAFDQALALEDFCSKFKITAT